MNALVDLIGIGLALYCRVRFGCRGGGDLVLNGHTDEQSSVVEAISFCIISDNSSMESVYFFFHVGGLFRYGHRMNCILSTAFSRFQIKL